MEKQLKSHIVYTEENVFFGVGINKHHYTEEGFITLCGREIKIGWKFDENAKIKDVDCKMCRKIIMRRIANKMAGDFNNIDEVPALHTH